MVDAPSVSIKLTDHSHRLLMIFFPFHVDVRFNDRWHTFTPTAARGGNAVPVPPDSVM